MRPAPLTRAWCSEEVHFPGSGKGLLVLLHLMSCWEWWLLLLPDNTQQHSSCWQGSTFTSPFWRLGLVDTSPTDSKVATSNCTSSFSSSYFCGSCSQKCFIVYVNMSVMLPVNNCDKNPTGEALKRSPELNRKSLHSQTPPANINTNNRHEIFTSTNINRKLCGCEGCYWNQL